MAVHTYNVNPLVLSQQTSTDVLWSCSGDADGIPFLVQFWQSATSGMTNPQLKLFVKSLIDAQVFPAVVTPAGVLVNFGGGTFTL